MLQGVALINQFSNLPPVLLAPLSAEQFFREFWEQKPLHISRPDYRHFASLLSIGEIETALSCHPFSYPSVQLTRANQPVAIEDYTDSEQRIVLSQLTRHYQQGATIVLSSAHQVVATLNQLTRNVQAALQLRSQASVSLSPPGGKSFNAHFDSFDAFILQISGSSTFRLYGGGGELPFSENLSNPQDVEVGNLTEEIQLNAGDTLYIPRGLIHDAVSDESHPSLHITLRVTALTLGSLFQKIVQLASEKNVRYRQSIESSEWHQTSGTSQATLQNTQQLFSEVFTAEIYSEALARLRDEIALDTPQTCGGWLNAGHNTVIGQGTMVRLLTDQIISREILDDKLVLRAAGRVVHIDHSVSTGVAFLMKTGQCMVGDITALEPEPRLALVTHLYQEQLLIVVD